MEITAKITGVKYKPLMCQKSEEYNFDKVNGLKDRILEIRNTINYLHLVLKHNQDIYRCVVENNE